MKKTVPPLIGIWEGGNKVLVVCDCVGRFDTICHQDSRWMSYLWIQHGPWKVDTSEWYPLTVDTREARSDHL